MGVWPHRGPCLLRFICPYNETCVFWALEFHVYNYEFNNSLESCTLENIISKYSKTSHADTLGAGRLSLLERLSYTKTIIVHSQR